MEFAAVIEFMKVCEAFKTCERTCRTSRPGRAESDAEHSWHLALLLMLLEKELAGLDFTRMLKMALIHDLPEIHAGDTNPYRDDTTHKRKAETRAAQKLFAVLPGAQGAEFKALFAEYLDQATPESRVVKSADKLLPLIQNIRTNAAYSSYRRLKVRFEEVAAYMDPYFQSEGVLRTIYDRLLTEARRSGVFYQPAGSSGKKAAVSAGRPA